MNQGKGPERRTLMGIRMRIRIWMRMRMMRIWMNEIRRIFNVDFTLYLKD